jgi:8-oxo-dGTP pyrophosphatase MutT (NUDIX family)
MFRLKQLFYKGAYPLLLSLWFIFRPHTYGAKVVIVRDGKVLLVKHSYGSRVWCFPGGGKKRWETLEETAIREAKEEVGLTLVGLRFIGSFVSQNEYKHDHVHVFLAHAPEGSVVIDQEEIVDYEWATHDTQKVWTLHGEQIWRMYLEGSHHS